MTRGRVGRLRLAVRGAAVAAASIVLAVAAVLATASVTARPVLFLAAGLLAGVGSGVAGARWAVRHVAGPGRRSLAAAVAGAAVLAVVGVGFAVAVPSSAEGRPAPVAGERFWQLPTGTRARYVEIPARGPRRPTPVVFVHGGPGTPDMPGDSGFFGRLADDGFDVYVYDQVGAGGSTRLADPEQHGLGRDVADLEAIRIAIGAQRMVLVGHSYGARVVAGYLAAHPGRVVRAVFSSPLSLDPADSSGGGIRRRLTGPQQAALYARLLRPRNLLVYGLLQVNPRAAHALAGDGEMDARNDQVYAATEPGLHCAGHSAADPPTGLGFYRLQYPQSAGAPRDPDLRPTLRDDRTPALVVKGSCDYLSWASAVSYLQTLRDVRLVYLPGGHNTYQDAPAAYLAALRAFLSGGPLTPAPHTGTAPPPGYEGPP